MRTRGTRRFGLARVHGRSMLPTLRDGDRLLVRYAALVRPGALVVARLPDGVVAVKRASQRRPGGWWLLSDNPAEGVDSRHRGVVPDDAVLAVVLARVWPRPRLSRSWIRDRRIRRSPTHDPRTG